jgi:hypothetical protein
MNAHAIEAILHNMAMRLIVFRRLQRSMAMEMGNTRITIAQYTV